MAVQKMGQQLEFKHESTFSDLTPKTIRLTDVYENSMNVVVEVDRQVKVEYGQTYTVGLTQNNQISPIFTGFGVPFQ